MPEWCVARVMLTEKTLQKGRESACNIFLVHFLWLRLQVMNTGRRYLYLSNYLLILDDDLDNPEDDQSLFLHVRHPLEIC